MKYVKITVELVEDKPASYSASVLAHQELRAPADAKPARLGKITEETCRVMLERDAELWAGIEETGTSPA